MPETKLQQQAHFEALFETQYQAICRYFARRVDAHAIEDLADEVFLIAWRRFADLPAKEVQWLYGIAANVLANYQRGLRRRDVLHAKVQQDGQWIDTSNTLDILLQRGLSYELAAALAQLSDHEREAMLLTHVEQLPAKQAAAVIGCSVLAFRARLSRGRRKLEATLVYQPAGLGLAKPFSGHTCGIKSETKEM